MLELKRYCPFLRGTNTRTNPRKLLSFQRLGGRRVGEQIWRFKNEITICQGELEAKIAEAEDWESTTERERDSDAGGAARNSRRRHYSAPAGHSAGSGHALATAAFFSGQIGQSMHLPVPIPICHCPPMPGAVPLSAETERLRQSRKARWESPNFNSIRV